MIRIVAACVVALSCLQYFDDLRLNSHVERRRRLVGNENGRLVRDRHRDHRALTHASGELVRELVVALLGVRNPDHPKQLDTTPATLVGIDARVVGFDRLVDLKSHSENGIQ